MSLELEGTLINTAELIAEQTSDEFNYNDFDHKPQINGVELIGNKTSEDLGIDIPTKTSELENDSGFITEADVPTKTSELQNDSGFITSADVPTKTSELENDSGFVTADAIPTKTSELDNDSGFITGDNYYDKSEIDTALSGKADKSDTYTKTETDNKIVGLIDDNSTANNKAWSASKIDGELSDKASTGDLALKADKSDTYTKAQTDNAIVGLIDDTTTANNKAWSSSKITDEIINILPTGTASGTVASFNTSLVLPLVSAKFAVNASQESGTPTPSTPRAISGWSAVNVTANGDTTVINLGGTYYGGEIVKDSNGTKFKITHNIVKFNEFTWGSGNWGSYPQFYTTLNDAKSNTVTSNLGGITCEIYSEVTPSYMYSNPDMAICLNNKTIRVRDSSFATKAEWEQATANYRIVYPLETPTEISLTDIDDIITVIGANSISCDSGNTEVVYKESINDAIAELQALFLS